MLAVEVRIKGRIDPDWSGWLGGLSVVPCAGDETLLSGILPDQSALFGVLSRLSDLRLGLVSVLSEEREDEAA